MKRYADFVDRILSREDLLKKLLVSETADYEIARRVRDAEDSALTGGAAIGDPGAFALVRGGLLYALDAIHDAHVFFQDAKSDLGSYWHGMMHRREGDFDNARYWFRRAGVLPAFAAMHRAASADLPLMAKQPNWDPYLARGRVRAGAFRCGRVARRIGETTARRVRRTI